MKKILLSLGTLATISAPIAAVVSCSNDDKKVQNRTATPQQASGNNAHNAPVALATPQQEESQMTSLVASLKADNSIINQALRVDSTEVLVNGLITKWKEVAKAANQPSPFAPNFTFSTTNSESINTVISKIKALLSKVVGDLLGGGSVSAVIPILLSEENVRAIISQEHLTTGLVALLSNSHLHDQTRSLSGVLSSLLNDKLFKFNEQTEHFHANASPHAGDKHYWDLNFSAGEAKQLGYSSDLRRYSTVDGLRQALTHNTQSTTGTSQTSTSANLSLEGIASLAIPRVSGTGESRHTINTPVDNLLSTIISMMGITGEHGKSTLGNTLRALINTWRTYVPHTPGGFDYGGRDKVKTQGDRLLQIHASITEENGRYKPSYKVGGIVDSFNFKIEDSTASQTYATEAEALEAFKTKELKFYTQSYSVSEHRQVKTYYATKAANSTEFDFGDNKEIPIRRNVFTYDQAQTNYDSAMIERMKSETHAVSSFFGPARQEAWLKDSDLEGIDVAHPHVLMHPIEGRTPTFPLWKLANAQDIEDVSHVIIGLINESLYGLNQDGINNLSSYVENNALNIDKTIEGNNNNASARMTNALQSLFNFQKDTPEDKAMLDYIEKLKVASLRVKFNNTGWTTAGEALEKMYNLRFKENLTDSDKTEFNKYAMALINFNNLIKENVVGQINQYINAEGVDYGMMRKYSTLDKKIKEYREKVVTAARLAEKAKQDRKERFIMIITGHIADMRQAAGGGDLAIGMVYMRLKASEHIDQDAKVVGKTYEQLRAAAQAVINANPGNDDLMPNEPT